MANDVGAGTGLVPPPTGDLINRHARPHGGMTSQEVSQLRAPPRRLWLQRQPPKFSPRGKTWPSAFTGQAGLKRCEAKTHLKYKGGQPNLIGVDTTRERGPSGRKQQMLANFEPLVSRDMPKYFCRHNPTTFNRAAAKKLGGELSLAATPTAASGRWKSWIVSLSPRALHAPITSRTLSRPLLMPDRPRDGRNPSRS